MICVKVNCVGTAVIICLITGISSVSAIDLGWDRFVQTIPSAYYSVSTPNVLRCGKLCERQGKCAAVTFDARERKCYMHDMAIDGNKTEKGTNGRYLIKNYAMESKPDAAENTCDKETQISIPTMYHKYGGCYNITEINGCDSSPCQNNATCEDKQNDYHCNCQVGFTGKDCSIEINECESSPCQNNATCEDKKNDYHCYCQAGYKGKNCSVEINECDSSPCGNNGTCVDRFNDYFCNCTAGFIGRNCSNSSCPIDSGYKLWPYSNMTLCIRYSPTPVSDYDDASYQCASTGGHLVLIENDNMRSHLVDIAESYGAKSHEWTYLNGRRDNSASLWIDWRGNEVNWLSWFPGYPDNNNCLRSKVDVDFNLATGICLHGLRYLLCQIDI